MDRRDLRSSKAVAREGGLSYDEVPRQVLDHLLREPGRSREILGNIEDVVYSMDAEGRVQFMSPAVERVWGYSPDEVIGRHYSEFVHAEDLPDLAASLERTLAGVTETHEFRAYDREGRLRQLRWKSTARVEAGEVVGVDGVIVDLSELRRAEEEWQEARREHTTLLSNLPGMAYRCRNDPDWTMELLSPGCEELTGYRVEDLIDNSRLSYSTIIHPEDRERVWTKVQSAVAERERFVLEYRIITADGDLKWVWEKGTAVRDAGGAVVAIEGFVMDITERRAAEVGLRESERRYRSLFDNTSVGIAHCRVIYEDDLPRDFVYLEVNPAFEALTGLEDVVGKPASEVMPGIRESDPELFKIYGRVARSGAPERFEIFLKALSQWFDVSVYSPQPDHFMAVFDVITQRKKTEENLVTFSRRLERLASVVQDLSQARSVESIVEVVRHAARALAGSEGATFILRDGDLSNYVDEDAIAPLWKGSRFPVSACISGWSMIHKQPAVIEDIYADERIPHDAYRPTFVKSLVMVPIRRESPVGAIGAYWATRHRATPEDVRILQALADSTSVAMENVRVLRELQEGEARTRAIYDHLPSATFVWKRQEGGFVLADVNEAAKPVTQSSAGELVGKAPSDLPFAFPNLEEDLADCFGRHEAVRREVECAVPGASGPRCLVLTYGFIPSDMVILHTEDVTEQRQTEEQLKLAQRLEAVARLAGGVAHDFNNLLSVILSYAGFAADALHESDSVRADVVEIQKAGRRAAALTRQLLAFSRKQLLEPAVLNLNEVVSGIESMLMRLLGEDIDVEIHLAESLGSVLADPGQIEQVIMNLAVNARDAMPQGGKLTIETANVELDDGYAEQHLAIKPGRFVMLSVTDTGDGMDAVTKAHIFEPFFTTKEKSKGTGLGLSMVYGIVKQSGGNIWVYSEPGRGTTFKIYLPRVDAPPSEIRRPPVSDVAKGSETVLVVEDEVAVCKLAERILRKAGYKVLSATTCGDAVLLSERHPGEINLLLTDVVMPQVSGRELAERLTETSPGLRVLYMSGYTDGAIVHHGVLEPGAWFIGKPFAAADLTRKVREVLDDEKTPKGRDPDRWTAPRRRRR